MEREDAVRIFQAATAAVQPGRLLREHISLSNSFIALGGQQIVRHSIDHIYIVGAGKAAAAMAVETESLLGSLITDGIVTTKYGHALATNRIKVLEAAHPTPDENSVKAAALTVDLLKKATAKDLIICLISGGASALWCDLPPGTTLSEVQTTFDLLIQSGASIQEINTIRKHLSAIKGGQLVRYCGGAKIVSLIISDVPEDKLDVIASGPTAGDASTFADAYAILLKYNLTSRLPRSIMDYMEKGLRGVVAETPKPGDPLFKNTINRIIGSNRVAVQAAQIEAQALGYQTYVIPEVITGDAEAEAQKLVAMTSQYKGDSPLCIIQGGETTVKVTAQGKGGRNQHFALAALESLRDVRELGWPHDITILSGGTDGTDGPTDAAGGVVDKDTLSVALQNGLVFETYLRNQDAYHFLQQTGSLLITGPTQTNVMDIMIAIVK